VSPDATPTPPAAAPTTTEPVLERHDGPGARAVVQELGALYAAAYRDTPQEHDPFYSAQRFAERLSGYTSAPGFALVTARNPHDHALIGYAFGYVLPATSRWWTGLLDPAPEGFTTETGHRTFALNELHVDAAWRGRGIASRLHQALPLDDVERATVLVRQDNPARAIYTRWGYQYLGRLQPYPDSPIYAALVLPRAT
jgi:ribosomal protein S18 acetylase RimI-like enzyme